MDSILTLCFTDKPKYLILEEELNVATKRLLRLVMKSWSEDASLIQFDQTVYIYHQPLTPVYKTTILGTEKHIAEI